MGLLGAHLVVFVLEEAGQGLHAGLQGRVLRLHLAAEARHHGHGRVQRVLVHQVAAVSDERQHAVQASRLEHGAGLSGADQLQHLLIENTFSFTATTQKNKNKTQTTI